MFTVGFLVFFFKQKTAYEMRISDWSSDVCSSDLLTRALASVTSALPGCQDEFDLRLALANTTLFGEDFAGALTLYLEVLEGITDDPEQIGRASCRERACQYV